MSAGLLLLASVTLSTGGHAQSPITNTLTADIESAPQAAGSFPLVAAPAGDRLLFTASTVGTGREVWSSDGTALGTSLVLDGTPGAGGGGIQLLEGLDGGVLISISSPQQAGVWFTDGSAAGTVDLAGGSGILLPAYIPSAAPVGSRLLTRLRDASDSKPKLWSTDGTAAGTFVISDVRASELTSALDRVFFNGAVLNGIDSELWSSDGTLAGTSQVADISASGSSSPYRLTAALGGLVFSASTSMGREPWFSDGTEAGTRLLHDIRATGGSDPFDFTALGDRVVFIATGDDGTQDLWSTDGSPNGLELLHDGDTSEFLSTGGAQDLSVAGDRAFFHFLSGQFAGDLWMTDGTPAGTQRILNATQFGFQGPIGLMVPIGSGRQVVFSADDGVHGREFWTSDGTQAGTRLLADSAAGSASGFPIPLGSASGRFYFSGEDGSTGRELHSFLIAEAGGYVAAPFGSKCGATMMPAGTAEIGSSLTLDVLASTPLAITSLFFSADRSVAPLGGCTLHLAAPLLFAVTNADATGFASFDLPVPGFASLVGLELYFQSIADAPGGPLFGAFELSNGVEVVIGS